MRKAKFVPHPGKQTEFLQSTADRVFFGGARGGSKSFSLAWKAAFQPRKFKYVHQGRSITRNEFQLLRAAGEDPRFIVETMSKDHPDYIGIIIRRTYPMLERNLKPECDKLYKDYRGVWQERNKCYVFPSGAKVYLVHCKDKKALDNYIGGNYNFIGIDEANQFPETWVDELETSLRTDNIFLKPQLCLTSNPGNIGHAWLKKKYYDTCTPIPDGPKIHNEEFDVDYQPVRTAAPYVDEEGIIHQFIPATVFDNPSLTDNDKKYVRKLKQLSPTLRAMWLEGRWDVFQGMFFDMWDPSVHILEGAKYEMYKKFDTDLFNHNTHTLFRFYDYGTKAPFVCLFAAVDKSGKMVIFDEIVETGLAASEQAKEVIRYSRQKWHLKNEDFADDICDPAYGHKHSEKDGERYSPAMFYEDRGIRLTMGIKDREIAAKVVYNGFRIPASGVPAIRFTVNCEYSTETIPLLPNDPIRPEDVDSDSEDHAYDALKEGAVEVLWGGGVEEKAKTGWRDRLRDGAVENETQATSFMGV